LNSDAIVRGTLQATVMVAVDGALGSPVSVPVILYADDTFPSPEGGVSQGSDVEAGTPDPGAGNPDAGDTVSSKGNGCGCALGGVPQAAASLPLLGLALLAHCLRRRRQ
jgi:hypothetical protein